MVKDGAVVIDVGITRIADNNTKSGYRIRGDVKFDEVSLKFVAFALKVPLSSVYGVATFYNFFNLRPQGKHTCVVYLGTACYIKGTNDIAERIMKEYSLAMGKTTEDGMLSLLSARCLGACGTLSET